MPNWWIEAMLVPEHAWAVEILWEQLCFWGHPLASTIVTLRESTLGGVVMNVYYY